jgi:hypothetical protein
MRPNNAVAYEPIDLKLGIKSSLPQVKSTLALLFLMWESEGEPSEIDYAVEEGDSIILKPEIESRLLSRATAIGANVTEPEMHEILGRNKLLTSQLESLIVAFELIWKVAKIRFSDGRSNGSERTGQKRYRKHLCFFSNMDIIGVLCSGNDLYEKTLFSWLGLQIQRDDAAETRLIRVLTALSESAVYKLTDGQREVIFNQESLYTTMLSTDEAVDVSSDVEPKGSLRILKSALSEGLIHNVHADGNMVSPIDHDELDRYNSRVVTLHQMESRVPGIPVPTEVLPDEPEVAEEVSAKNILLYGVPGCGKSHEIKTHYCDDETRMERVVFHPDYTYSDFVGQIMPSNVEGHIAYPFISGPFTRILKKAKDNPDTSYYLIIEEINRGNAPAIFGDIFQLLDRKNGESEYGISNSDIAEKVYDDPNHLVKIPANLYLLATMNTADQNVFTLDTAFKRRWTMRSIPNDFSQCHLSGISICGSGITWRAFAEAINGLIIELSDENLGGEDKRLGAYFVSAEELRDRTAFSEKVLMYLWNDAFKYDHDKVFRTDYKTLEQLLHGFEQSLFDVFVDGIAFPRNADVPNAAAATDEAEGDHEGAGDR